MRAEPTARTCDLEPLYAIHVQALIDHPASVTEFHSTRPKLHERV